MLSVMVNLPEDSTEDKENLIAKEIELWIIEHMPRLGPTHIVISTMDEEYVASVFRYGVKFNVKAYPKFALLAQFTVKVSP